MNDEVVGVGGLERDIGSNRRRGPRNRELRRLACIMRHFGPGRGPSARVFSGRAARTDRGGAGKARHAIQKKPGIVAKGTIGPGRKERPKNPGGGRKKIERFVDRLGKWRGQLSFVR